MRLVLFGPRTRLARAVLANEWVRGQPLICVARTPTEAEWIRNAHPAAEILPGWNRAALPQLERVSTGVLVCAAGLIHPAPARLTPDSLGAVRDLGILEAIVRAQSGERMHVVFMSSVLALGRSPGRGYYAAWKAVMEESVAGIVQNAPGACLSIFYPGRLVEKRSVASPMSLLSTPYRHAAEVMIQTVRTPGPWRTILGLDARLWLAVRGLVAWRDALVGRPRTEILRQDVLPDRATEGDPPC